MIKQINVDVFGKFRLSILLLNVGLFITCLIVQFFSESKIYKDVFITTYPEYKILDRKIVTDTLDEDYELLNNKEDSVNLYIKKYFIDTSYLYKVMSLEDSSVSKTLIKKSAFYEIGYINYHEKDRFIVLFFISMFLLPIALTQKIWDLSADFINLLISILNHLFYKREDDNENVEFVEFTGLYEGKEVSVLDKIDDIYLINTGDEEIGSDGYLEVLIYKVQKINK